MMSSLYQDKTQLDFYGANSLKQQGLMSLHLNTLFWFQAKQSLLA